MSRTILKKAKRVVVKAGTRMLLDDRLQPDMVAIRRILEEMIEIKASGRAVIFVSSGAIGTGLKALGLAKRPDTIPELQAAAAVGQALLMQAYNGILRPHGHAVAQLLLTHDDFQDRRRYLNMRNMLTALDGHKVLPVINENDTVSVDEIRFGDNDVLAGLVANAVDAEATVLLSDVDGFYQDGKKVDEIREVTPDIEAAAGGTSGLGSGGMVTKLRAARIVTAAGGCLVLAQGKKDSLRAILEGKPLGTLFLPSGSRLDHRKRWIAHTLKESGALTVDEGGAVALRKKGRSLLPVGITACAGKFEEGDAVVVRDPSGNAVAKGLVNYSSDELHRIMGKRTDEIGTILGDRPFDEVIHRDNMVILS